MGVSLLVEEYRLSSDFGFRISDFGFRNFHHIASRDHPAFKFVERAETRRVMREVINRDR